jgi:hypothetical protein
VLTKKEENRLLNFERKALRPKIVKGEYRNRYNFELDREFNSPNVIGGRREEQKIALRWAHDKRYLPQKPCLRPCLKADET